MNKSNLKSYAPQARRDFIAAITARANLLGVAASAIAPCELRGDIAIIGEREWPAKVAAQRAKLVARIGKDGFEQTIENIAYTWFNRFAALRFMELHDYLEHGWRVLSSRDGGLPELLHHAADVSLAGLDQATASAMQLAGDQDNLLYKMLLVAQCNSLAQVMPFLFEAIDDETELLLPENLLRNDSIIAKLVAGVPEEDWQAVEAIGWLYQFYISEKKDEVIGKVVRSEDIPAATQLFTPNWIVQYLVQNSIGRLWLMANPSSTLQSLWPYYIAPAPQTPEVDAQLAALIQARVAEDGLSLQPESISVLDPACGSGHILVEAYALLKAIYLERGYRAREIPRLILEKNLYGIDIDDRAAQLAGFALMMKAREDDRRLFDAPVKLNVMALQQSSGLDDAVLADSIMDAAISIEGGAAAGSGDLFGGAQSSARHSSGLTSVDVRELIRFFAAAKTFGSLLTVPPALAAKLAALADMVRQVQERGNTLAQSYAIQVWEHYLKPALTLARKYDAVIANPPYMGGNSMPPPLKLFAGRMFPDEKNDLYALMLRRSMDLARATGYLAFVTMHMWMYIGTFEDFRRRILGAKSIISLCHFGAGAFSEINGEVVKTVGFVLLNHHINGFIPAFLDLQAGDDVQKDTLLMSGQARYDRLCVGDFLRVPAAILCYQAPPTVLNLFDQDIPLGSVFDAREGMTTADNARFLRFWWEIDFDRMDSKSESYDEAKELNAKWWRYQKGGEARKWYGNNEYVVNWENDGCEIRSFADRTSGRIRSHNYNENYSCREGVTWSTIGSTSLSVRYASGGHLFDTTGIMGFSTADVSIISLIAFLNSKAASYLLKLVSPMLRFKITQMLSMPFVVQSSVLDHSEMMTERAIEISMTDWNSREISFSFECMPIIGKLRFGCIELAWSASFNYANAMIKELQALEVENNSLFIDAYGLQDELTPEVPEDQITLARADREKDSQRLISYAIGCMMGRYSLDEPGLIYAHAGNIGFDATRYQRFPADTDGILPVTDELWFEDDAGNRISEFLRAVWGAETQEENLAWLAESLSAKPNELPGETIRRYIAANFFKHHLQTYKKRPIYWLFSSGKQGAFQALVYLHRYHEGTLARLRTEYVVPLTAKFAARIDMLAKDVEQSGSAAGRAKIEKQIETLRKKQAELLKYDEKLRHYADMRIQLDLDDGVKVNYAKFGDLLAEVKAVTGGKDDE